MTIDFFQIGQGRLFFLIFIEILLLLFTSNTSQISIPRYQIFEIHKVSSWII